jgi:hypothetical protein
MHGAAFRGVNPIVEFLVEKGAKLDPRDSRGEAEEAGSKAPKQP